MENWMDVGKALEEILRPQTYPLAVRLVRSKSEFPEGTRRPEEKLALCQALTLCRKYGRTMGFTEENSGYPAVNIAYGWTKIVDESVVAQFFLGAGYTSNESGARRIVESWARLKPGKFDGVVVSPLTRTKVVPHVILVYGTPAQIMRLIQGAMYKEGKTVKSELAGVAASCNWGIVRTYKTDECQVVLLGNGDRVFASAQDHEMLFAIPAKKAEETIEGMKAQRFAKYPIPVSLRMPPPFPGL